MNMIIVAILALQFLFWSIIDLFLAILKKNLDPTIFPLDPPNASHMSKVGTLETILQTAAAESFADPT